MIRGNDSFDVWVVGTPPPDSQDLIRYTTYLENYMPQTKVLEDFSQCQKATMTQFSLISTGLKWHYHVHVNYEVFDSKRNNNHNIIMFIFTALDVAPCVTGVTVFNA